MRVEILDDPREAKEIPIELFKSFTVISHKASVAGRSARYKEWMKKLGRDGSPPQTVTINYLNVSSLKGLELCILALFECTPVSECLILELPKSWIEACKERVFEKILALLDWSGMYADIVIVMEKNIELVENNDDENTSHQICMKPSRALELSQSLLESISSYALFLSIYKGK